MAWENGLTRRQARTLRHLAQVYLASLERKLPSISLNAPPEPGQRERPYVLCRWAIDDMKHAIRKLRRIEQT